MVDFFAFRNQAIFKTSSDQHIQDSQRFSVNLRKKKRYDLHMRYRRNEQKFCAKSTENNFRNKQELSRQEFITSLCKKNHLFGKETNEILELVAFDSQNPWKPNILSWNDASFMQAVALTASSTINLDLKSKLLSYLNKIFLEPSEYLSKICPELILNFYLKYLLEEHQEEHIVSSINSLKNLIQFNETFFCIFHQSPTFKSIFLTAKEADSLPLIQSVLSIFKVISSYEERLKDEEVEQVFDALNCFLCLKELEIINKSLLVLSKFIRTDCGKISILLSHEVFNTVINYQNIGSISKGFVKVILFISNGNSKHIQVLIDFGVLNVLYDLLDLGHIDKYIYAVLASISAGTTDQLSQILYHPIFEKSKQKLTSLDAEAKEEASYLMRNIVLLSNRYFKTQLFYSDLPDILLNFLDVKDTGTILNILDIFEQFVLVLGKEMFESRRYQFKLEALLENSDWKIFDKLSKILDKLF